MNRSLIAGRKEPIIGFYSSGSSAFHCSRNIRRSFQMLLPLSDCAYKDHRVEMVLVVLKCSIMDIGEQSVIIDGIKKMLGLYVVSLVIM